MIDLGTIAEFTWCYNEYYHIQTLDGEPYVWLNPDHYGDNTIRPCRDTIGDMDKRIRNNIPWGKNLGRHTLSKFFGKHEVIFFLDAIPIALRPGPPIYTYPFDCPTYKYFGRGCMSRNCPACIQRIKQIEATEQREEEYWQEQKKRTRCSCKTTCRLCAIRY
jgi:hypothetical protein